MPDIRVLIVDDHPVVCEGIRSLLEAAPGIRVTGEAYTGQDALRRIRSENPDVVLLDMEMPDMSGVEVIERIAGTGLTARILGLSSHDDREFISQLLTYGAAGYLLKDEVPDQIVEAVRGVAAGETGWVSRRVAARLTQILRKDPADGSNLTARELEVLKQVVAAKTNAEIALQLGISEKTVEKHLDAIFRKLAVTSRVQAAVLAVREKLV
jgi:two-component system NarL family response regulator